MVSFAAYSSLQGNEEVSLSDMALENAEALAGDINPECPDGCLTTIGRCYCFEWYDLEKGKWPDTDDNAPND